MTEGITITPEQLAERDAWDRRLMEGKCTIDDAMSMCMYIGAPISPFMREQYEAAWNEYRSEKKADLADLLGVRLADKDRRAMERATWVSNIRFHVDSYHEQGFSKNNPSHYENTAFHEVAKRVHRSPSQIFDTYHGK